MMTEQGNRNKYWWVLGFTLFVILLTTAPYLAGFLSQGADWRFTGLVFGVDDGISYLAKMRAGASGEWLFHSPYATQQRSGSITYLPYIYLGKLAIMPGSKHIQLVILFHLFRIAGTAAVILMTYDFIGLFIEEEVWKRAALVLIVIGGGMGWLALVFSSADWFGYAPLDFVSPESFGFLGIFGVPHLTFARALFLLSLKAFITGRSGTVTGGLWLLLSIFQPIYVYIAWIVSGLYILIIVFRDFALKGKTIFRNMQSIYSHFTRQLIPVAISAPFVGYLTYRFFTDDFLTTWRSQNIISSPSITHYFFMYGWLLPFLVPGAIRIKREYPDRSWLLLGWMGVTPVLVQLPIKIQRRLAEGIWVVLIIIAVKAFSSKYKPLDRRWSYVGILAFPSTIVLLAGAFQAALNPGFPVFRPAREVSMFQYIETNLPDNSIVLSSYETGNALPAWAPVHVVLGHRIETVPIQRVIKDVERVFQKDTSPRMRNKIIVEYDTDYIYWGPHEKKLGDWDPGQDHGYKLLFRDGAYNLYQVTHGDEGQDR